MPVDASSLIPPALDQLREHPEAVSNEVPRLLERLAEVPDPRDPRGVWHALFAVLALTACAVLAGATSLLAVSEWITDAPPRVLERLGIRLDRCSQSGSLTRTAIRKQAVIADGGNGTPDKTAAPRLLHTHGHRRLATGAGRRPALLSAREPVELA
ncbi:MULTISPECIES: transposase family protein [unclassified Streptomyces]|uniref:transposase family protein n=1 Tax=unclassified Streptomyces TaxID=2593676 RepID=UPI003808B84C